MSPRSNPHVARLNRFLPFSVSHDQIYEEYQTDDNSLSLETVAFKYIQQALQSGARCIVLTGDAGHGKTHLCRKLLEKYLRYSAADSRKLLLADCDGDHIIPPMLNGADLVSLRVHKDFSEIDPESAAAFIEKYANSSDEALVICANEGRLRAVISSIKAGPICSKLHKLFQDSFITGLASSDGKMHIVNLNFQSVSVSSHDGIESLVMRTLRRWVLDGRGWSTCSQCSLSTVCPIKRNRDLLDGDAETSENRINKIERLCSTAERLGHVITIREMLMLVAYIITGGMTCEAVQRRLQVGLPRGWQHEYAYYNLLFRRPPQIPEDRLFKGIPILESLCRLDPGKTAKRSVDEGLLNAGCVFLPDQLDLQFDISTGGRLKTLDAANGIDEVIGSPQSKADRMKEARFIRMVVAGLRRRSFFDEAVDDKEMLSRLGFRYGDDFLTMLEGGVSTQTKVKMKNLIVAGLHGIQGLRLSATETTLYLVDPAFGRASADAAIVARQIPTRDITLLPEHLAWDSQASACSLSRSVDWTDRTVVIRIDERLGKPAEIALGLMAFECIARSASGFISEGFYAHEMRRIRTFLGKLAERGRSNDGQISLFMNGRVHTVSLDMGVIQVSGGED